MNIKHIYSYILELNKTISKVEYENPIINWNSVWKQIHMTINSTKKNKKKKKTIIFRHNYGILPLGDYLIEHKI